MADDVAAERARLEALAWGGGVSDSDAAEARVALERLGHRRAGVAPTTHPGGATPVVPSDRSSKRPAPPSTAGPATSALSDPSATPDPSDPSDPAFVGTASRHGSDVDHPAGATEDGGGGSRLPSAPPERSHVAPGPDQWSHDRSGRPGRLRRALRNTRPRVWVALGVAAAVGVAFAAGTAVGTARPDPAAAPTVTPSAGTVTLEDLLDEPQTYADQLPGPVEAPVSLRTTRLVFTNRALDGGSLETPWNVWAGVGTDRSTICLVATANRIESTSACYPRADALHGSVSLSAQSMSGTLTLTLRGGGVQGTVTNEN